MPRKNFDKERYLIDMHLAMEKNREKLQVQAKRLAMLALCYQEEKNFKDAVSEMKRSLLLNQTIKNETVLQGWEKQLGQQEKTCPYGCGYRFPDNALHLCQKCSRMVRLCPGCDYPNKQYDCYCRWCGGKMPAPEKRKIKIQNIVQDWFYPLPIKHLSTPPVIVGDLVIAPLMQEGSLLALKALNGERVWQLEDFPGWTEHLELIHCYPYLYFYSSKQVGRLMPGLENLCPKDIENIHGEIKQSPLPVSFPKAAQKERHVVFPVNKGLLYHDMWRKKGTFLETNTKKNDILFPVAVGEEIFIFSRAGRIYKAGSGKITHYSMLPGTGKWSPPVYVPGSGLVYFERYTRRKRYINAWSPQTGALFSKPLDDLICDPDDSHFHYPPNPYKSGVLLVSGHEPLLYHVRSTGNDIQVKEIPLSITDGNRRVLNIEYLFSMVHEPYFISKIPGGFFYVNIENTKENGIEVQEGEMMCKPIVFENRLIFICKDGIRCFTFEERGGEK
jgi:hypothetical protein